MSDINQIVLLLDDGTVETRKPSLLKGKVKSNVKSERAAFVLIPTGIPSSYAMINTKELPKRFRPMTIRYKLTVSDRRFNQGGAAFGKRVAISSLNSERAVECNNFAQFISFLYSVQRMYLSSGVSDISAERGMIADYDTYYISIASMIVEVQSPVTEKTLLPTDPGFFAGLQANFSAVLEFLQNILRSIDGNEEFNLLTVSHIPSVIYATAARCIIDTKKKTWSLQNNIKFKKCTETLSDNSRVGLMGFYSNDLVFATPLELEVISKFGVNRMLLKFIAYHPMNDVDFPDNSLLSDLTMDLEDIYEGISPYVYKHEHIDFKSVDDVVSEVSLIHHKLMHIKMLCNMMEEDDDMSIRAVFICLTKNYDAPVFLRGFSYDTIDEIPEQLLNDILTGICEKGLV